MDFCGVVANQLCVGPTLENDAPTHVVNLVKVLQEMDAVCHDDSGLGSQQTVWPDDIL